MSDLGDLLGRPSSTSVAAIIRNEIARQIGSLRMAFEWNDTLQIEASTETIVAHAAVRIAALLRSLIEDPSAGREQTLSRVEETER